METQEQIRNLIDQILEAAPETFSKLENKGSVSHKVKETIQQLESLIKSSGYICHGTKGGRNKWVKDIAASLIDLIELLPLVSKYERVDDFKKTIETRLKYKLKGTNTPYTSDKLDVVSISFGKLPLLSITYYAAEVTLKKGKFVVVLDSKDLSVYITDEYTKRFTPCKQNKRHSKINKTFDLVCSGLKAGLYVINKDKQVLEWKE